MTLALPQAKTVQTDTAAASFDDIRIVPPPKYESLRNNSCLAESDPSKRGNELVAIDDSSCLAVVVAVPVDLTGTGKKLK
jgi:hypothetical protein